MSAIGPRILWSQGWGVISSPIFGPDLDRDSLRARRASVICNGDPGHRVHLIARKNPLSHPLTDAIIDARTNHLCYVRFEMRQSIVAVGYTSTFELNIDDVNGASLVRSVGMKSMKMTLAYDCIAF